MESYEQEILKKLKSGISVIGISKPEEYIPAIPNFIKAFVPQAEEGSPRALVLCLTDDDAKSIHEVLEKATKEIDLTIDLVFDKGSKLKQRNDLFDGTEVIVGTTKRICELYFQNGFNVGKLKLFIVFIFSTINGKPPRQFRHQRCSRPHLLVRRHQGSRHHHHH